MLLCNYNISLRGAHEGVIICDVTHGRVVTACCKTSQNKYLFVLKQDMTAMVMNSDMKVYIAAV